MDAPALIAFFGVNKPMQRMLKSHFESFEVEQHRAVASFLQKLQDANDDNVCYATLHLLPHMLIPFSP